MPIINTTTADMSIEVSPVAPTGPLNPRLLAAPFGGSGE